MSDTVLLNRQIRRIEDSLRLIAGDGYNQIVNMYMKRLSKNLEALQKAFFVRLTNDIVGADGPPALGMDTPIWQPLSSEYTERREFDMDVPEDEFFRYSGQLEVTLANLDPKTFLGTPMVYFRQGSVVTEVKQRYTAADRIRGDDSVRSYITIDMFPKIASIRGLDEADLFKRVRTKEKRGNKTYVLPLSYRLKNFQGARERPIMSNYLSWWLNTQARTIVRSTL